MSSLPNYYAILEVAPSADRATIRRRYLRQMRQARRHPDLGGAHADAALVNEAYTVLGDPQRRAAFDRQILGQLLGSACLEPVPAGAMIPDSDRRRRRRLPYAGMVLIRERGGLPSGGQGVGIAGQCRNISQRGCCLRTLRPLASGERMELVFHDDPGLILSAVVRWRRIIPQRFGLPVYEGGLNFARGGSLQRFAQFLERAGFTPEQFV